MSKRARSNSMHGQGSKQCKVNRRQEAGTHDNQQETRHHTFSTASQDRRDQSHVQGGEGTGLISVDHRPLINKTIPEKCLFSLSKLSARGSDGRARRQLLLPQTVRRRVGTRWKVQAVPQSVQFGSPD